MRPCPEYILLENKGMYPALLAFLVYDAFEHWKDLVTLLTNCRECLATRTTFYLKLLGKFYFLIKFKDAAQTQLHLNLNFRCSLTEILFSNKQQPIDFMQNTK